MKPVNVGETPLTPLASASLDWSCNGNWIRMMLNSWERYRLMPRYIQCVVQYVLRAQLIKRLLIVF